MIIDIQFHNIKNCGIVQLNVSSKVIISRIELQVMSMYRFVDDKVVSQAELKAMIADAHKG